MVGTFLIWRDEIRHPDPAYAVSYGILTVAFALRELILFDQARTFRHALAVGDDDLKTELPRMFLRYLGSRPTNFNRVLSQSGGYVVALPVSSSQYPDVR